MKKIVRLSVFNTGVLSTGGTMSDSDTIANLLEKIDEGDVSSEMEFDDGTDFCAEDYDNIFSVYSPCLDGSTLILEVTEDVDKDEDDRTYKEFFKKTDIDYLTVYEPSSYNLPQDVSEDASSRDLIIYTSKEEKRVTYSAYFEVDEVDEIDFSNIYIAAISLEESTGRSEGFIDYILYIPKDKLCEYFKLATGNTYTVDDLDRDTSYSLLEEEVLCPSARNKELIEKIKENHKLDAIVEGSGSSFDDFVKVITLSGEELFES